MLCCGQVESALQEVKPGWPVFSFVAVLAKHVTTSSLTEASSLQLISLISRSRSKRMSIVEGLGRWLRNSTYMIGMHVDLRALSCELLLLSSQRLLQTISSFLRVS